MIVCEPCGGTDFAVTQYQDVFGLGVSLIRCTHCGTFRYDTIPVEGADAEAFCNSQAMWDSIERDYRNGAANNPDPSRSEEFRTAREDYYRWMLWRVGWVLGRQIESLYEVGTAYGALLDVARSLSIQELGGCDINRRGAELARERGLPAEGVAWQKAIVNRRYDSIIMLDYIEHTLTPRADLEKAVTHLKDDGVLLLKTFVHEWHEAQELVLTREEFSKAYDHKHGYFNPYCHHWHFTKASLLQLFDHVGLLPVSVEDDHVWGQVTIYARLRTPQ